MAKAVRPTLSSSPPICGAETKTCGCGHRQFDHDKSPVTNTKRGPCHHEGCKCQGFKGKPHTQSLGLMLNGRCRIHGGSSLSGLAHPNYRTGASSQTPLMPARIQEDYEALLQDDQLLSVREEIAREKAYYRDIERRGQDGSIVCLAVFAAITKVGTAADALVKARAGKKTDALRKALDGLMASIDALIATTDPAVTEAGIRSELRDCRAAMKDLVKVESQHVERLYNMITSERAFAIMAAQTAAHFKALEQYVPDPAVRTAIKRSVSDELRRLAYRRDHPVVDAGGRREAGADVLVAEAEE